MCSKWFLNSTTFLQFKINVHVTVTDSFKGWKLFKAFVKCLKL